MAVLSGAASLFTVSLLLRVAAERGVALPGPHNKVYRTDSLTEDFELTLAAKALGCDPRSPQHLVVVTDVMTTVRSLWGQRVRWQRGYLESLCSYPLRLTWGAWSVQALMYLLSVLPLGMGFLYWQAWSRDGLSYDPRWFAVVPVFVAAEVVEAWRGGWRARLLAAMFVPGSIYNIFRSCAYWRALALSLRRGESAWT